MPSMSGILRIGELRNNWLAVSSQRPEKILSRGAGIGRQA